MSLTKIAASPAGPAPPPEGNAGRLRRPRISTASTAGAARLAAAAADRDQMLDRLQRLRAILPVFAQELASARRHAAQLRRDNSRLLAEVHRLQHQRDERAARR